MIDLFNANRDEVIRSSVAQGATTYEYALKNIFPLIDKFEEQRKVQRRKFYERLKQDIIKGCLMPPITLAFVNPEIAKITAKDELIKFVSDNINQGYVLDGMQRLTTLEDASSEPDFDPTRPLYVNVIVAERYDLLLYRMITLNNGQKPMTARHQIEMLTKGMLDTGELDIEIVSEKETEQGRYPGSFRKADVAAAYTAFLTNSVNNENARIIESKLDEILVGKVMDSNLSDSDVTFSEILSLVSRFSVEQKAKEWLRLANNLIGFSVGARKSFLNLNKLSKEQFVEVTTMFEESFSALDVSKINVGKFRRELAAKFIADIDRYEIGDVESLTQMFIDQTLVD